MEITSKYLSLADLYESVRGGNTERVKKLLDELGKADDATWSEAEEFNLALLHQVFKNDPSRIANALARQHLTSLDDFLKVVTNHIKRKRISSNCCML